MLFLKDGSQQNVGQNCSSFFPWHRAYVRDFEADLKAFHPHAVLPYWDWTDPESTKAAFSDDFLGALHGGPITGPLAGWKKSMDNKLVVRAPQSIGLLTYQMSSLKSLISRDIDYKTYAQRVEEYHNFVHFWVGGDMIDITICSNDPVAYLHHTNVDRLFSLWQDYGHPNMYEVYWLEGEGNQESGNRREDEMFPWDGGKTRVESDLLNRAIEHKIIGGEKITVGEMIDYRRLRIGFDREGGQLAVGEPKSHKISRYTSVMFNFVVQAEQAESNFCFETSNTKADLEMELFGPALCYNCFGAKLAYDKDSGAEGFHPRICLTLGEGKYTVIVRPQDPTTDLNDEPFFITATIPQTQMPQEPEAQISHPLPIGFPGKELPLGVLVRSSISPMGKADAYQFKIPGDTPRAVMIETKGHHGAMLIFVKPPDEDDDGFGGHFIPLAKGKNEIIRRTLEPGTHHITIYTTSSQAGQFDYYTIQVKLDGRAALPLN